MKSYKLLTLITIITVVLAFHSVTTADTKVYCTSTNTTCWPSVSDISGLSQALDPSINRTVYWVNKTNSSGYKNPYVTAVPIYSPGDEPFYGAGENLQPVYRRSDYPTNSTCFVDSSTNTNMFCLLSVRNNPMNSWTPGFIVFPTNETQV
jgi:hypothetical protein